MPSNDGVRPDSGSKFDSFDDDAIRIELRRIVEEAELRILEKLAATENDIRTHCEASKGIDEDAERKLYSGIETAKSDLQQKFQMMLDFIQRR